VAVKKESTTKEGTEGKAATNEKDTDKKETKKLLSEEEKRSLSERYQIGKKHFFEGRYREALEELQKISAIDPNFNTSLQTLIASSKEGLSKLEEQERKRKEEEAAAERRAKVKVLVAKANEYVKDHRADLAQEVFNDVAKIDPENIEISRLKREIDDWVKEKQRKELEIAQKKKDRDDKVEKLKLGRTLYLQKEWYLASNKLDDFLKIKDMDEDLTKEAAAMLKTAREEVSSAVSPLLGKSKSLMEGQDLKGAYEVYQQILKIEPSNAEALNATGEIKDVLTTKARKIYREAIISESLSLFPDAKEKFQEVQQVSPVDSAYYKKASDKLKDYLD
jgi:tetratricopeptide (TPR) repeat protein